MIRWQIKCLTAVSLVALISGTANAALLSRLSGQAHYDSELDITWAADANLAASNNFGISTIESNGAMSWATANEWIAAVNGAAYLGQTDWRLPLIVDSGNPGCDWGNTGTDCGYDSLTKSGTTVFSEMAYMYYETLGNVGRYDTSGNFVNCPDEPIYCLTNQGPFSNIQTKSYWSGTSYGPNGNFAWTFGFGGGAQGDRDKSSAYHAWAVRSGDIAVVPLPASVWLLGSSLAALGALRHRRRRTS
jgi:hypothetical protein